MGNEKGSVDEKRRETRCAQFVVQTNARRQVPLGNCRTNIPLVEGVPAYDYASAAIVRWPPLKAWACGFAVVVAVTVAVAVGGRVDTASHPSITPPHAE